MPITVAGDPPGSRLLSRLGGDQVDEETILEWSPNGAWVKTRPRVGPDVWQKKDLVDQRELFRLADVPPALPVSTQ